MAGHGPIPSDWWRLRGKSHAIAVLANRGLLFPLDGEFAGKQRRIGDMGSRTTEIDGGDDGILRVAIVPDGELHFVAIRIRRETMFDVLP